MAPPLVTIYRRAIRRQKGKVQVSRASLSDVHRMGRARLAAGRDSVLPDVTRALKAIADRN